MKRERPGMSALFALFTAASVFFVALGCQGPLLTGSHQSSGYTLNLGDLGKILTIKSLGDQTDSTLNITIRDLGLNVPVFEGAVPVSGQTVNVDLKPNSSYSLDIVSGLSSSSPLGVHELRHSQTFTVPASGSLSLNAVLLPYKHWYLVPYVYYSDSGSATSYDWSLRYLSDTSGSAFGTLDLGSIPKTTLEGFRFGGQSQAAMLTPLRYFRNGDVLLANQFGSSSKNIYRLSRSSGTGPVSLDPFHSPVSSTGTVAFFPDIPDNSVYHLDHTRTLPSGLADFSNALILSKTGGSAFSPWDLTAFFRYQINTSAYLASNPRVQSLPLSFVPEFYGLIKLDDGDFVASLNISQTPSQKSLALQNDSLYWTPASNTQASYLVRFGPNSGGVPVVKASYPSGFSAASIQNNDNYFVDLQLRKNTSGTPVLYALKRPKGEGGASGNLPVGQADILTFDLSGGGLTLTGNAGAFAGNANYAADSSKLAFPAFFLNEPWEDTLVLYEDGKDPNLYSGTDVFRVAKLKADFSGTLSSVNMPQDPNRNSSSASLIGSIIIDDPNQITWSFLDTEPVLYQNGGTPSQMALSISPPNVSYTTIAYEWHLLGPDSSNESLGTSASALVDANEAVGGVLRQEGSYVLQLLVLLDGVPYSESFFFSIEDLSASGQTLAN